MKILNQKLKYIKIELIWIKAKRLRIMILVILAWTISINITMPSKKIKIINYINTKIKQ